MKSGLRTMILLSIMTSSIFSLKAQDHDHGLPHELGFAVGLVYDLAEEIFAPGVHLHYTRMLHGKFDKVGIGGGLEGIFDEHKHYNGSIMATYRPVHGIWISAGPGITYFTEGSEIRFSIHIETGYEFETGPLHLGPIIEYAVAGGDQHFMFGLHVGYPF